MIQKLDAPVSVVLSFDSTTRRVAPTQIVYHGRNYPIVKLGLHHTARRGRTLFHIFSVASASAFFRLVLNTDNLSWRLEEVSDNESV